MDVSLDTVLIFLEMLMPMKCFFSEDNVKINNRLQANIGSHIGYYALDNTVKKIILVFNQDYQLGIYWPKIGL